MQTPKQCSRRGLNIVRRAYGKKNRHMVDLVHFQRPFTHPEHLKPVNSLKRRRKKIKHIARKLAKSLFPNDFEKRQVFVAEYMTKVNQQLKELGHGS